MKPARTAERRASSVAASVGGAQQVLIRAEGCQWSSATVMTALCVPSAAPPPPLLILRVASCRERCDGGVAASACRS